MATPKRNAQGKLTWKDIEVGAYKKAPKQTSWSKEALNRATWQMNSLAVDYAAGRLTACEFQGNYDMTQSLNMPIQCKKIGTESRTKKPVYQCFRYPALGRNPLLPIDLGLCKRKGRKRGKSR